jgi:hypothetical protein
MFGYANPYDKTVGYPYKTRQRLEIYLGRRPVGSLAQTNISLDYRYNIKAARYPAPEVCTVVVQLMLCSYANAF